MSNELEDDFDYVMSDTFISETRRVSYRTGFRPHKLQERLTPKQALALSDEEFRRYVQNGCQLPADRPADA